MGTCGRDTLTVNGVTWHADDNTACTHKDEILWYIAGGRVYHPAEVTVIRHSDEDRGLTYKPKTGWGLVTE